MNMDQAQQHINNCSDIQQLKEAYGKLLNQLSMPAEYKKQKKMLETRLAYLMIQNNIQFIHIGGKYYYAEEVKQSNNAEKKIKIDAEITRFIYSGLTALVSVDVFMNLCEGYAQCLSQAKKAANEQNNVNNPAPQCPTYVLKCKNKLPESIIKQQAQRLFQETMQQQQQQQQQNNAMQTS